MVRLDTQGDIAPTEKLMLINVSFNLQLLSSVGRCGGLLWNSHIEKHCSQCAPQWQGAEIGLQRTGRLRNQLCLTKQPAQGE